jgi:hypothetical protein
MVPLLLASDLVCVCCCCCHLRTSLVGEHKWGALPNLCLKKKKKKKKVEVLVESQAVFLAKFRKLGNLLA